MEEQHFSSISGVVKLEILELDDEGENTNEVDVVEADVPLVQNSTMISSYNFSVNKINLRISDPEDSLRKCKRHLPKVFNSADNCITNDNDMTLLLSKADEDMFEFIGSDYYSLSFQSLVSNSSDSKIQCYICYKKFSCKLHLEEHFSVHTKEKRYKCLICGKTYCTKTSVQRHVKCHKGLKSFKCGICGRTFSQKVCLTRHFVTHTGERQFQCFKCSRKFSCKGNLKQHMKLHLEPGDEFKSTSIVSSVASA